MTPGFSVELSYKVITTYSRTCAFVLILDLPLHDLLQDIFHGDETRDAIHRVTLAFKSTKQGRQIR